MFPLLAIAPANAEEISLSGVGEGAAVTVASGAATTNLTFTGTFATTVEASGIAFALERQGALFMNLTSAAPYSVTFSNLTVGKYFLSARGLGTGVGAVGDLSFDVKAASARPVNDDLSQASTLAGLNVVVSGSNTLATSEPGEPKHADVGAGKSLWWSWTAPSTGIFTATTKGSSFDTALAIYLGSNTSALSEVVASDDIGANTFSQSTFTGITGATYYIAVDSASETVSGEVKLSIVSGQGPLLSITPPATAFTYLVSAPSGTTNVPFASAITDASGIAQASYSIIGPGAVLGGAIGAPYQVTLPNLTQGHYSITLAAMNNAGLISVTNSGFSVVSVAPQIILQDFKQTPTQYQFGLLGFQGASYSLEASTNLSTWTTAVLWTNFTGAEILNNTNTLPKPNLFYRAVLK